MFEHAYVDSSTQCTSCGTVLNFTQKFIRQVTAAQSMLSKAAVICIKGSNSIEDCVGFATMNPTAYTILMANTKINIFSSLRGKSIIIGGHGKDE